VPLRSRTPRRGRRAPRAANATTRTALTFG
jgi:hypothetical protein